MLWEHLPCWWVSFSLFFFFQGPLCESLHRDALRRGRKRRHQRCSQPIGQSRSVQSKHFMSGMFCFPLTPLETWCTDSQLNQTVIFSWSTNHADRLIMYLRAKRQFGHGWDFCPCDLLDGKLWFYFAWFLFFNLFIFLLKPIWPLGFNDGILSSLADLSPTSPLSKQMLVIECFQSKSSTINESRC